MKFEQINRKFTETVAEWMAKGYIVNTATMSGSQGEIGKIDLTDGKEIIRVVLGYTNKPWVTIENRSYSFDGVELAVGRITDNVQPHTNDTWGTAWTSNMEVLSSEVFYEIGRGKRDGTRRSETASWPLEDRLCVACPAAAFCSSNCCSEERTRGSRFSPLLAYRWRIAFMYDQPVFFSSTAICMA